MNENLPLFRKTYAFTIVLHSVLHHMPREYRYSLGAEAAGLGLACLDLVMAAAAAGGEEKKSLIRELSREFNRLSIRIRILQELKIISRRPIRALAGKLSRGDWPAGRRVGELGRGRGLNELS
jgi:hypothetical protein